MNDNKIVLSAKRSRREKKIRNMIKLLLLIFILLLVVLYVVVGIIYNSGNFTITLDKNLYYDKGIVIYDNPDYKTFRSELFAKPVDTFDNISYKWLPGDLNNYDGSHNGNNYMAYTFYIENLGKDVADYYSNIVIDDVIKNVDEAVRLRVYKNDEVVTYAKVSKLGGPEKGTTSFESDTLIKADHVENFKPGDKIKYTVVLWLEGSDPECNDNILGGEIKMHMEFNSEFVEK